MAKSLAPKRLERLLEAARAVRSKAHAPYSRFFVGAAVLDEKQRVHAGCNVENAVYPHGMCAEANAIGAMVAAGGKRIAAIVIVGEGKHPATPCGGCRQMIRELAARGTPIIIADSKRLRARYTLEELLPASFGPENLEP